MWNCRALRFADGEVLRSYALIYLNRTFTNVLPHALCNCLHLLYREPVANDEQRSTHNTVSSRKIIFWMLVFPRYIQRDLASVPQRPYAHLYAASTHYLGKVYRHPWDTAQIG